jgi:hypothetical protein
MAGDIIGRDFIEDLGFVFERAKTMQEGWRDA